MKKQHKTKALDVLNSHSSAGHGIQGLLQEILRRSYREQASVLAWRHPFLAGIFWESTSFY